MRRQRADGTFTFTTEAHDAAWYWPVGTRVSVRGHAGTVNKQNPTTVKVTFDNWPNHTGRVSKDELTRLAVPTPTPAVTRNPFDYDHCRVCGTTVSPAMRDWAARQVENATCGSAACTRKELIARFACCDKADVLGCVCAYAFRCPDHGDRHIGSHD